MGIFHQVFFLHLVMTSNLVCGKEGETFCYTPQYAEYGSTASINCEFEPDFYAVYWYNSTRVVTDLPIITLENSVKSGRGFDSNEFDVHQNGSLVINEVTLEHDHIFTVIYVKTKESSVNVDVLVIVTVKPSIPHPSIDKCGLESRVCYAKIDEFTNVTCSVLHARPSITLYWLARSADGNRNVSSRTSISDGPREFSTQVTIHEPFNKSRLLQLLICKAIDSFEILEDDESVILVENKNTNISNVEPTTKQAFYDSEFSVKCVEGEVPNVVWKRKMPDGTFHNVAVSFENEKIVEKEFEDSFMIGESNSLVISHVKVDHEGAYACIYSSNGEEGVNTFKLFVAVLPEPKYPLVEGCDSQMCTKRTGLEGSLTCEVQRIRPQISLEWRVRYPESSQKIKFKNRELKTIVSNNGDTYDVYLTSEYTITDVLGQRLTLECSVVAKEFESLEISTTVDLLYQNGTTGSKGSLAWLAAIFILLFILGVCLTSCCFYRKKHPRKENTGVRQSDLEGHEEPHEQYGEKEPLYHELIPENVLTANSQEMEKLKQLRKRLQETPNLDDIRQVPALFVKFLAISEEIDTMPKFYSVTNMFKYLLSRFFDYKRSEVGNQGNQSDFLIKNDHRKLDRLAFNGLLKNAAKGTELMWNKDEACKGIGEKLYQECVNLGIFVQSESLYNEQLEVRFYDKLICHWYAAHYFSYRVLTYGRKDARKYLVFDPCEHCCFYYFSCGLHLAASEEVKKYLTEQTDGKGERLAIMCDLEETGNLDNTKKSLKDIFKNCEFVEIRQEHSKLFRMSTLQLCIIGHSLQISVPPLWLIDCFVDVDIQNGDLKLKNGLTVPLDIFKEVRIEEKKQLKVEKFCQILELAAKSRMLESIVFYRCLVPESFQEHKDLLYSLQRSQIKVKWFSIPDESYNLNFQSGHWEVLGKE